MRWELLVALAVLVGLALLGLGAGGLRSSSAPPVERFVVRVDPSCSFPLRLPPPPLARFTELDPKGIQSRLAELVKTANAPTPLLHLPAATVWDFFGTQLLYVPVPSFDQEVIRAKVRSPLHPEVAIDPPREMLRPSLWFLEVGQRVLYGAVFQAGGLGLVFYERLTEAVYRQTIETLEGEVLVAAEGPIERLDPALGHGRIRFERVYCP